MKPSDSRPPQLAKRILLRFLRNDLAEEVSGDLEEKFYATVKTHSLFKARLNYWFQVLHYLRPFALKKSRSTNLNYPSMFRHTLLLSYRSFLRYKSSFVINLTGLSSGLACTFLIYLWVNDELNFDKIHEKDRQLYEVMQNIPLGDGEILTIGATPGLLAEALKEEMPEVEDAAVATTAMGGRGTKGIISIEDIRFKASDLYVTKNFFDIFSFRLIHGSRDKVLSDKNNVLLSDELALKMFNTTDDVIGKTVEWKRSDLTGSYVISGIFEKPPVNSSAQFDLLFSYELFFEKYRSNLEQWGNSNPSTYIILREGTDLDQVNQKISDYRKSKWTSTGGNPKYLSSIGTLFLQRYSDKYLYNHYENGAVSGGRIGYVKLFSLIALFLLSIACINFMNLSTARASRRLKEIGIKKAIGADRKALIFQYLGESMLMAFLSLMVAILLVALLLHSFNDITGKQLALHFDLNLILAISGITLVTGILSGSYPALYLSGFKPVTVLKGIMKTSPGESWARKGLVVFQFAISILLIVSVVVVYKQIEFIQNKNLGYNKDNIIKFAKEGNLREGLDAFMTEVKNMPGVLTATTFSHNLTGEHGGTSGVEWEGKNPDVRIEFGNLEADFDLIEMMEFEMVEGNPFSRDIPSQEIVIGDRRVKINRQIIFNEAAIAAMGLKDPVGKTIKLWGQEKEIVGVVKDFHFESLYEQVKPCFLQCYANNRYVLVKIKAGMERETVERIQEFYQSYNDGIPFEYKFLDDDYQALYSSEQKVGVLSRYFAGIAILVSCLGLFGLAAFTAERRRKEIGIRKVLGSSVRGIVFLLSNDFTKIVLVAIVVALPVSYLVSAYWLESFAYRIELELWYFIGAGFLALLIPVVTVGAQAVQAARVNPTECLKEQ